MPPPREIWRKSFGPSAAEELTGWLESLTSQEAGKPWPPNNPAQIFFRYHEELEDLYEVDKSQSKITKRDVWLEMLKGSGTDPQQSDQDELFVQHTLLVTVARAVIASLAKDSRKPIEVMSAGFASWPHRPNESGGASSVQGENWTNELFGLVKSYEWRQRGRDVLRDLYQELVSKQHRKDYGEYYTPDWLAEGVVEKVLDEAWITRSVKAVLRTPNAPGVGVLDPTCGSGTFLFHSARRILSSKVIKDQNLTDGQRATVAANLVQGIDIHPVAIEMAKATLLRALPCPPPAGNDALQIFQGDSLLWNQSISAMGEETVEQQTVLITDDEFKVVTPKEKTIKFPPAIAKQKAFSNYAKRLVTAAQRKEGRPEPIGLVVSDNELAELTLSYDALKDIIAEEGDNVWAWYINNATGPLVISARGVDRIVANPPWVRMSDIQLLKRKRELEKLAKQIGLWGQGKTNTSFNIAALFVDRCSSQYLGYAIKNNKNGVAAGWVLPWGCVKADSWKTARKKLNAGTEEVWDLREVKDPPFKSSASAVWIRDNKKRRKTPPIKAYKNKGKEKVRLSSTWSEVKELITVTRKKQYPILASDYQTNGKAEFANGATFVPHCLVKIESNSPADNSSELEIVTSRSRHEPWKSLGAQKGVIPKHWVRSAVDNESLLSFAILKTRRYVIPIRDHKEDIEVENNEFWSGIDGVAELYASNRGKGRATPKTLFEQINFQNKLLKQKWSKTAGDRLIAYNSSGGILRSARFRDSNLLAEHKVFWMLCDSPGEAQYLTALLNADKLQPAFASTQKSDWDFNQDFLFKIPIPKFESNNPTHTELAKLCVQAEAVADELVRKFENEPDSGKQRQIARSKEIREALRETGIAKRIDAAARKLLPKYTS